MGAWLSVRLFCFFASWSVFLAYWGVWLLDRGFTVQQTGWIITAGLVARAMSFAVVFPWLTRRVPLPILAGVLPWLSAALALLYLRFNDFASTVGVSVVLGFVYPMIMPLNETVAAINDQAGLVIHAKVRSWGSAGFIVGMLTTGFAIRAWGADVLAFVFIAWCLAMAIAGIVPVSDTIAPPAATNRRLWRNLLSDRDFLVVLGVAMLLHGAHATYYAYGAVNLRESGVPDDVVALVLVLAVVGELVLFRVGAVLTRWSMSGLFLIATAGSIARWGALAISTHPAVFIASQVLHAATFAVTHIAYTRYVRDRLAQELAATAYGSYAAAMSLSVGVFTVVAGALYPVHPNVAFVGMVGVCLPCLAIRALLTRSAPI